MEHAPLTHADRCDRCGAQAIARTVHDPMWDGQASTELLWCMHHYREHEARLTPTLVTYKDVFTTPKEPVGA